MSHDIRDILQRLTAVEEGKLSPTTVKKGLTAQQDRVPQLPALFKPKKISVLGSGTDPQHPMKGYAVGANESALAETMANIEEDMVSKIKKDLTHYLDQLQQKHSDDGRRDPDETPDLDRLTKKEKVDRDLIQKAVTAIDRRQAEEDLDENDYDLTEPETVHAVQDKLDTMATQPQQPVQVMEIEQGKTFEVFQIGEEHFEIRHRGRPLRTKFGSKADADIALNLFKDRYQEKQRHSSADYIEER
jgi:hypothetical protein